MSNVFARFAVESGKITKPENQAPTVRRKLFEPNSKQCVSVSRIDGLLCDDIKREGLRVTKERGRKHLYGWAEITKGVLQCLGFKIVDDPSPSLHSILKWPSERKDQLMIQTKLAQKSKAVLLKEKIAI